MKTKIGFFTGIILVVGLLMSFAAQAADPAPEVVNVDGKLFAQTGDTLSIIVVGTDVQAAAQAVQAVGGQVFSHLNAHSAVVAHIPAAQLDALMINPAVRSLVSGDQPDFAQLPVLVDSGA